MDATVSTSIPDEAAGNSRLAILLAMAMFVLVFAAFILINSKIGDLIGRKRAYVVGLIAYAIGALTMALTQSLLPVIIFWAIFGGIGASLLLPAMQSLIHGNFEGKAQAKAYALVGAAAMAAHWRIHHDLPIVARRLPAGGRHYRGGTFRDSFGEGRTLYGAANHRYRWRHLLRCRNGRRRPGHPRLAGGRREGWS